MTDLHVLSLGAGVQSTALYLMFMEGIITPQIDYAIFADTMEEPGAVYRHLEWLKSLSGPPIIVRSAGKLGDESGERKKLHGRAVRFHSSVHHKERRS